MRKIKLYEELFRKGLEINLGLELEKVARKGKELTFQQFLDSLDIKPGDVDGKEMGLWTVQQILNNLKQNYIKLILNI